MTIEKQNKGRANRKGKLTPKEKKFSKEYAKTLNGTQAVLASYDTKSTNVASAMAVENLAKPRIREEIARLLSDNDIELSEVLSIHKRNMVQGKHLPTSQKAVNDVYELLGLKDQQNTTKVNIAFVIEN